MTEPAIRVSAVTKVFPTPFRRRRVVALRDLGLEIAPGEIYGLLGPNGSGKSTTLKIILGLIGPTRGSVRIFGRDNSAVAVRRDIGFLPENACFHKFLTGAETLRFHAKLSGLSGCETKSRVAELLSTVGLARAADARLGTYSKGMLQRIGLAQALIHHPKILVLDEPTAAVDPAGSRDFHRAGAAPRLLRPRPFCSRSHNQFLFSGTNFFSTRVASDEGHCARCHQFLSQHARHRCYCATIAAGSGRSRHLQRAGEAG